MCLRHGNKKPNAWKQSVSGVQKWAGGRSKEREQKNQEN